MATLVVATKFNTRWGFGVYFVACRRAFPFFPIFCQLHPAFSFADVDTYDQVYSYVFHGMESTQINVYGYHLAGTREQQYEKKNYKECPSWIS